MDLPSCVVLDPSSAKSAGVKGLVVLARGRAQLHSLCVCEGFFGIPAIWQFQVLGRILAFCRSFPSPDHCYVLPHSCNALRGCRKVLQDKPADVRAAFTWDHSRVVRTLATMIVLPVLARSGHDRLDRRCPLIGVEQKSRFGAVRTVVDPVRTSGLIQR